LGKFLVGLAMEDVGILFGHSVYFYSYLAYFVVCNWVYFLPSFGMLYQEKSGNPTIERRSTTRCTRHPAQNWKGFYLSFLSLPRTTYSSTKIMQYIVFFIIMYTLIEYVRNSVIGSKGEKPHLSIGWFGFHGGPFFRHEYFSSKSLITFLLGRRSE
jgi:hypothetical protein